ncbi:MAG: hypothetical protein JOZ22_13090 [Acidobacteriia bacterium]|nr:hypothetical protein [Terriglobia bacterium]
MAAQEAWPLKLNTQTKRNKTSTLSPPGCCMSAGPVKRLLRWLQGLQERIDTLSEFPERCQLARESKSLPFELRHGRKPRVYRILFTIEANTVHIIYIRRPGEKAVSLN